MAKGMSGAGQTLSTQILGMVVGLIGIILAIFVFGGFAEPLLQAIYNMTNVEIVLENGSTHLVTSPLLTLIDPSQTVGAILWGAVVLIFIVIGLFSVLRFASPTARR